MDTALWVIGRGMGVGAVVLLTLTVLLGIVTRGGRPLPGLPRFAVQLVHRDVALASTVLVVVHVVTLLLDTEAELRLLDTVVPFVGAYRWFWLGLGTLAVDLLVVLVLTAMLRRVIGPRVFRAVHWAAYAMWPIALAHAIGTGTDGTSVWFLVVAAVCTAAVLGAVCWRCTARVTEFRSAELEVVR
ncbi:ferric reductase-like transmembrane domain-containing protein [Curtobacterium sp. VKM Ac-1376]|uniref:ferric reductase-like transmembrane domain-containing protein n=1 Tax=Curtobacterium sp. VKM Ac-1376 TaxID=123312 RepID=UPI00188C8FBE|nr:ferric reductase-like transmembrane domain-containing protein [Curtobacterium sp. VKM Ac-1376]MBF4614842.1 ferric reductase-like transmembrane domain-containing protein [Curtobacterium sp. VKM Ac-1376]